MIDKTVELEGIDPGRHKRHYGSDGYPILFDPTPNPWPDCPDCRGSGATRLEDDLNNIGYWSDCMSCRLRHVAADELGELEL